MMAEMKKLVDEARAYAKTAVVSQESAAKSLRDAENVIDAARESAYSLLKDAEASGIRKIEQAMNANEILRLIATANAELDSAVTDAKKKIAIETEKALFSLKESMEAAGKNMEQVCKEQGAKLSAEAEDTVTGYIALVEETMQAMIAPISAAKKKAKGGGKRAGTR